MQKCQLFAGHAEKPGNTQDSQSQDVTQPNQQQRSEPTGLRNVLSSSAMALAGRAYACAPSQSATGRGSNKSSTSGNGSVMVHSRGSSIQGATAATQSHMHAPAASEIEPSTANKIDAHHPHASSSGLSNVQGAAVPKQGEQQGWQHAEEHRSAPVQQQRPQVQVPAVPVSSPFPLKLAEVTEADRLEQRSRVPQSQQSAVVARVLGRVGGSALDNPLQVCHLADVCNCCEPVGRMKCLNRPWRK